MGAEGALRPVRELDINIVWILAPLLEVFLYGVYLSLSISALPLLVRKEALKKSPGGIFLVANVLMFTLISVHTAISGSELLIGFALATDVYAPRRAFNAIFRSALSYAAAWLGVTVAMIADFIVIYRCFLVWQRKYRVVIIPILLALTSTVVNSADIHWAHHVAVPPILGRYVPPAKVLPFLGYLVQNALTSGLIVFRIWSQSRVTRRITRQRPVSLHVSSFTSIMRIIAESAMIYTLSVLGVVIALFLGHPVQYVMLCCLVPTTGIAFALMAVRTHGVREKAKDVPPTPSLLPTWLINRE